MKSPGEYASNKLNRNIRRLLVLVQWTIKVGQTENIADFSVTSAGPTTLSMFEHRCMEILAPSDPNTDLFGHNFANNQLFSGGFGLKMVLSMRRI